jgi:hypothetical protein
MFFELRAQFLGFVGVGSVEKYPAYDSTLVTFEGVHQIERQKGPSSAEELGFSIGPSAPRALPLLSTHSFGVSLLSYANHPLFDSDCAPRQIVSWATQTMDYENLIRADRREAYRDWMSALRGQVKDESVADGVTASVASGDFEAFYAAVRVGHPQRAPSHSPVACRPFRPVRGGGA